MEKAAWVALISSLMFAEIRNLYVADEEQTAAFSAINAGLNKTKLGLDQTVTNLGIMGDKLKEISGHVDIGAQSSQQAAETATDAINTITGGKGFCYITLSRVDMFGKDTGKLWPTITVKRAKVIWHVSAHVVDYKAFQADKAPITGIIDAMNRDANNIFLGDIKSGSGPIFQPIGIATEGKEEIDYLINFFALNGSWTEELHYRHDGDSLEYANRVVWSDFPNAENIEHEKKTVVFQDISPGFGKVDWVNHLN